MIFFYFLGEKITKNRLLFIIRGMEIKLGAMEGQAILFFSHFFFWQSRKLVVKWRICEKEDPFCVFKTVLIRGTCQEIRGIFWNLSSGV